MHSHCQNVNTDKITATKAWIFVRACLPKQTLFKSSMRRRYIHAVYAILHYIITNLLAVLLHHFVTFHSAGTTVAAIVRTSFVVVVIVTIAVSKVRERSTTFLGVDTRTLHKERH